MEKLASSRPGGPGAWAADMDRWRGLAQQARGSGFGHLQEGEEKSRSSMGPGGGVAGQGSVEAEDQPGTCSGSRQARGEDKGSLCGPWPRHGGRSGCPASGLCTLGTESTVTMSPRLGGSPEAPGKSGNGHQGHYSVSKGFSCAHDGQALCREAVVTARNKQQKQGQQVRLRGKAHARGAGLTQHER